MPDIFEFLEDFSECNPDAMYPTGFEKAIVGYVERCGESPLLLIDSDKCVQILMDRDKMDALDASEYFEFNIKGAYLGPGTPYFVTFIKNE